MTIEDEYSLAAMKTRAAIDEGYPFEQQTPRRPATTDDADFETVLKEVLICCNAWVPDARIIGNIRAVDIARAVQLALMMSDGLNVVAEEIGLLPEVLRSRGTSNSIHDIRRAADLLDMISNPCALYIPPSEECRPGREEGEDQRGNPIKI